MSTVIGTAGKDEVRCQARALGFSACGFTSAAPIDELPLLGDWVARGRHGHMGYLAGDLRRRLAPLALLPTAQSVIVVAWPYPPPPQPRGDWRRSLTGRIAAYALGRDYHDVMTERLGTLAAVVAETFTGARRAHVDAGPLLEKDLARRAGLGWFGHNTNILVGRSGSYFLLGCLLTEARFEPDPPFAAEHCGTCRACIPACPTGALDSGPTIDAPRCISYLTIEHRGPIEPDLRARIGNWVFGCDVCQEVCPWNPSSAQPGRPELEPYLPDLLALTSEEFRDRYAATAVGRAKRRGLARNAAVALGNTGNPEAVDPLATAVLGHDEPLVRAHAAWALGRVAAPAAGRALAAAARRERVPPVVAEIEAACATRAALHNSAG
jgi:epoxyqueuosine reductase